MKITYVHCVEEKAKVLTRLRPVILSTSHVFLKNSCVLIQLNNALGAFFISLIELLTSLSFALYR